MTETLFMTKNECREYIKKFESKREIEEAQALLSGGFLGNPILGFYNQIHDECILLIDSISHWYPEINNLIFRLSEGVIHEMIHSCQASTKNPYDRIYKFKIVDEYIDKFITGMLSPCNLVEI